MRGVALVFGGVALAARLIWTINGNASMSRDWFLGKGTFDDRPGQLPDDLGHNCETLPGVSSVCSVMSTSLQDTFRWLTPTC